MDDRQRPNRADHPQEPEDAGPRAGEHPTLKRTTGSRRTYIAFAIGMVAAALMYAAIVIGITAAN